MGFPGFVDQIVLGDNSQHWGVHQKGFEFWRAIDGEINLFDKENLVLAVPALENHIEGFGFDVLSEEKEFGLFHGFGVAVVREFEEFAKLRHFFGIFGQHQKEIGARLDVLPNQIGPTFQITVHRSKFSLGLSQHILS